MRFILLIAAVVGLLASPVAAESRAGCGEAMGMAMDGMPDQGAQAMMMMMMMTPGATMDPASMDHSNCDPGGGHKGGSSGCGLACLAMCGALAALPAEAAVPTRSLVVVAVLHVSATASPKPYPAQRLERPPRAMA